LQGAVKRLGFKKSRIVLIPEIDYLFPAKNID
jgi:hypothetical protein